MLPLVNFYTLATLLVLVRIVFQVFFFDVLIDFWIVVYLLPLSLKFLLGIELSWINVELICTMRYSIKVLS